MFKNPSFLFDIICTVAVSYTHLHRSNQGGGEWEYKRRLPEKWKIHCGEGDDRLTLIVSPTLSLIHI